MSILDRVKKLNNFWQLVILLLIVCVAAWILSIVIESIHSWSLEAKLLGLIAVILVVGFSKLIAKKDSD